MHAIQEFLRPDSALVTIGVEPIRQRAVLDLTRLLVPKRLYEEDVGDAIETLHELAHAGARPWKLWLKVATTVFWVGIRSALYVFSLGKEQKKAGRSDD